MDYSSKVISLRNNPPFSQLGQSKFKLKWNITSFRMFGSVPTIPTDRFIFSLNSGATKK